MKKQLMLICLTRKLAICFPNGTAPSNQLTPIWQCVVFSGPQNQSCSHQRQASVNSNLFALKPSIPPVCPILRAHTAQDQSSKENQWAIQERQESGWLIWAGCDWHVSRGSAGETIQSTPNKEQQWKHTCSHLTHCSLLMRDGREKDHKKRKAKGDMDPL